MSKKTNLTELLDTIHNDINGDDIKVGELVTAVNSRGFGPFLLCASLITILPTGAIPGVPAITGLIIVFIAGQMLIGRSKPWLPKRIKNLSFKKDKFEKGRDKVRPYTKKIDKFVKPRLTFITNDVTERLIALICVLLAASMPIVGLVPFAAMVPAFAIGLMGLGLSNYDGAFILGGVVFAIVGITALAIFVF